MDMLNESKGFVSFGLPVDSGRGEFRFFQLFSDAKVYTLFLGWEADWWCFMFIIHLCICMSFSWWLLKVHRIWTDKNNLEKLKMGSFDDKMWGNVPNATGLMWQNAFFTLKIKASRAAKCIIHSLILAGVWWRWQSVSLDLEECNSQKGWFCRANYAAESIGERDGSKHCICPAEFV